MATPRVDPTFEAAAFTCLFCDTYAQQTWCQLIDSEGRTNIYAAECVACVEQSVWVDGHLVYPLAWPAPEANDDMPASTLNLYEEAAQIAAASPRAAAALLRVAIDDLCTHLGCTASTLNGKIAELVGFGVPPAVYQALDIVRVTGNEAVHEPGRIILDDGRITTVVLFEMVNQIVEYSITLPGRTRDLLGSLPADVRRQIDTRNQRAAQQVSPGPDQPE